MSASVDQISRDGLNRNLGRKPVLIPAMKVTAKQAAAITNISLEIHGSPEDEALIAAAPELLKACKFAAGDNDGFMEKCEAAIAQAQGGTQ